MSLSVRFDERIFLSQRRGGVTRYFAELARAFVSDSSLGVDLLPARVPVENEHVVEAAPAAFRPASPLLGTARRVRGRLKPDRAYPPAHGGAVPNLLHYTYYETDWLVEGVPTVSTVHDMISELLPTHFSPSPRPTSKLAFVESSDGIICVSQSTKTELERLFGTLGKPVAVIPLGVGDAFRTPRAASVPLPEDFVLFVGQRGSYKNFIVALDAFELLRAERPSLRLVCVGGLPWSTDEQADLDARGLTGVVERIVATDADLPGVYAAARLLLFPSSHEGFGLPVLEAMAAGCPVVVADTAVAHEVSGGVAAVATELDGAGVAAAAAPLLTDGPARAGAVEAGRAHVVPFTWERTARATADFYRQVLHG